MIQNNGGGTAGSLATGLVDGAGEGFSTDSIVQASLILFIGILIIVTNVIIIASYITTTGEKEVLTYYLISLAVADLCFGVFVLPLSVYPTLVGHWVYADFVCKASGYISQVLWIVELLTLTWMSVDRYVAIRKPLRYSVVQTRTKVLCWVGLTWLSAAMLSCPPMLGFKGAGSEFDPYVFVCFVSWDTMTAYAITLVFLLLSPTISTMLYTYIRTIIIFNRLKTDIGSIDKEYASALTETLENPAHISSFIIVVFFWASWLPFLIVKLIEHIVDWKFQIQFLHFSIFWIGLSNSFFKFFIYLAVNKNFRFNLRLFCMSLCCCGVSKTPPATARYIAHRD